MVEDLQLFRQITTPKEDSLTNEETETDIALLLSSIELMEPSTYASWQNEAPKTSVFFKSGSSATILADFKDLAKLWQRYLRQAATMCHNSVN